MSRLVPWLRFFAALAVFIALGYLLTRQPTLVTYDLPDGKGSLTLPRNLEGWQLVQGTGDVLLTGRTRLGLQELEVVRTPVPAGGDLRSYIAERQSQGFKAIPDYHVRLRGERTSFAGLKAPIALATYTGEFLGMQTRFREHELFLAHQGQYLRLTFRYPDWAERYVLPDHLVLAERVRVTP